MESAWFICPVCTAPLRPSADRRQLVCARGHSFDIARQGYVSLVTGRTTARGDTAAMVRARRAFLAGGAYEPIAAGLSANLPDGLGAAGGRLADLGGGTGYYSAHLLREHPTWQGVLLDVSAAAARLAATAHPGLTVATADLWASLPLVSHSLDAAIVVFAPRRPAEILRVLRPGGRCLVVTPGPRHLIELRRTWPMVGLDPAKADRLADQFAGFRRVGSYAIEYQRAFSRDDVANVIAMGPSAFHLTPAELADIRTKSVQTTVTVSVVLSVFCTPAA